MPTPMLCIEITRKTHNVLHETEFHNSSRLGMRISQLLGPGTMPIHQLYNLPISMMKILVLRFSLAF
jgi:hypothetical protein